MKVLGDVTNPTATKPFVCDWCGEAIEVGERHSRWCYVDTAPQSCRVHLECYDALMEDVPDDFGPVKNPRGCNCGFSADCERCAERKGESDEG